MYTDEQFEKYNKLFENKTHLETAHAIDQMDQSDPDTMAFRELLVFAMTDSIPRGFLEYGAKFTWPDSINASITAMERQIDKGVEGKEFYTAFVAFIKGQRKRCMDSLASFLNSVDKADKPFNEFDFDLDIVTPFKDGFPGFYPKIKAILALLHTEPIILDLCDALEAYYKTPDMDERADIMSGILQKYPASIIATTCLGMAHYAAKRWGAAVACFEKLDDAEFIPFYHEDDFYFFKAVSYTKLREHNNAIEAYKKALEIYPETPNALNNLGYEYYLTKQYGKALETFQRCMDTDSDLRYAVNNYFRTLLALKRYSDARAFGNKAPVKISASLLRRLEKKDAEPDTPEAFDDVDSPRETNSTISENNKAIKDGQFSSEKLLEDELNQRIEHGLPTFGRQLKMYRRHGEYGRQYIIPIGRLDLLAEDDEGSLFIIELKKDSGYDDAYVQIRSYIDWFDKNRPEKKIRGILCLNNPPKKLIQAVRQDDRVQLFNYQIVYEEVK